jgi:subtilisin family serine protease
MSKAFVAALIISFLIILPLGAVSAVSLSGDLQNHIAGKAGGEFVRVLIVPAAGDDTLSLKHTLAGKYATRAERHRFGLEKLKAAARKAQPEILQRLETLRATGGAKQIKSFWIADIIETEIRVSDLATLADDPGIEQVELYPIITSVPLIQSTRKSAAPGRVGANLRAIKADSAWAAGYDGRGRIVCSFDTGVDGDHPALAGNYRGNKGYPASQCWFSSVDSSQYPHAFQEFAGVGSSIYAHGTHTTGIMIGHDDATGDTIGVAPGADWIAAVAIDIPGSSIFEAFQWAADPDGNPATVSDVPDVINHSWGVIGIDCSDIFSEVIDNIEALGVVNIFAAGNEGPNWYSVRNPANRVQTYVSNFAVGAVDTTAMSIWIHSSRGPSICGIFRIKPNVVAPGIGINSSVPTTYDQIYNIATGTSSAAPHVSGAVAILRQRNPDATVDQVKLALQRSARDLGVPGPDSVYGYGAIDIMAALHWLDSLAPPPTTPSLQLARLDYPEIAPGDQIKADLALKNVGATATGVNAVFANPDSGITLLTDKIDFGDIPRDSVSSGNKAMNLRFDDSVEPGRFYCLDMSLDDDSGNVSDERICFFVGDRGVRTYYHHETGVVAFTISNYGAFGFSGANDAKGNTSASYIPLGFDGYRMDRDTNDLYQASLVIGVDSMHVSDCAQNIVNEPDNDFAVSPGGSITVISPGDRADQETESIFDDHHAENPIGLTIQQHTYGWTSPPDNTFIILEYIITNTSVNTVNGIRAGLFCDWDIPYFSQNHGSFVPHENVGYMCRSNNGDSLDFRGVEVLNKEGLTNHRIYIYDRDISGNRFTEGLKYKGLADPSMGTMATSADIAHMTATGPFNLGAGECDTAAFAVIGGATWTAFMESAARAAQKYDDFPTDVTDLPTQLPGSFSIRQNYPNPFNPHTRLSFFIPRDGHVRVDIFDILGRKVQELFDGRLTGGDHSLDWTGTDGSGRPAASGIYFYRIEFNGAFQTRKMILLR